MSIYDRPAAVAEEINALIDQTQQWIANAMRAADESDKLIKRAEKLINLNGGEKV